MNEICYIELNNWFACRDYPATDNMHKAVNELFGKNKYCQDNKIAVVATIYDMSHNFNITCTKDWIEKNYPELLETANKKFWRYPENGCDLPDAELCGYFLEYEEENFGVRWRCEEDEIDYDYDEEDF